MRLRKQKDHLNITRPLATLQYHPQRRESLLNVAS